MSGIQHRIKELENYVYSMGGRLNKLLTSDLAQNWRVAYSDEKLSGIYLALCVNTLDPLKRNRIQVYTSVLQDNTTDEVDLRWVEAISVLGGLDDGGVTWVPPAGSTVVIIFAGGNRESPYYLGTTHPVSRGTAPYQWGYNIQEYYNLYDGQDRLGYLSGPNDGSQFLPPWTSENYNAIDATQFETFDDSPDAFSKITYPNIFGFKTSEKHCIKMVDGDHKCNDRWKRFEIYSSRGNIILMKDDHLNPGGQWANPKCTGQSGSDLSQCTDESGNPIQSTSCVTPNTSGLNQGSNPYYKRMEECRLYAGAPTPQNNKCALVQSGLQIQSISGHQIVCDDSVEQPTGIPKWYQNFDFGCTNKFTGKMFIKSATGHSITLNDMESATGVRGDGNGINLTSAAGQSIVINDHTIGSNTEGSCPPNQAGEHRGIFMQSSSNNVFQMIDQGNQQCSPMRAEGGQPIAKASNGGIIVKTGYGLSITLMDDNSQEHTQQQAIQLLAPQKENPTAGPHMIRMQESVETGGGYILVRAGGIFEVLTYGNSVESVGTSDNPADKVISVSRTFATQAQNTEIISKENTLIWSHKNIYLLGGEDCPDAKVTGQLDPCVSPVLVLGQDGKIHISDRVFASASPQAPQAQLAMLM